MYTEMNNLRTWFRTKIANSLFTEIDQNLYEKFEDLENVLV
jgi:hypothetical protein